MNPLKIIALCSLFGAASLSNLVAKETAQPNILFLFTDDHAYNTAAFAGNSEVKTPHLDKLSEQGTTFTRAYNMGAWYGAVCLSSRGMMNTGRFLWRVRENDFGQDMDKEGRIKLWPERMKELGYETYFSGKWHTFGVPKKMFDHMGALRGGMPEDHPDGYNRPLPAQPDPWSPSDPSFGGYWKGGKHWSEALADESLSFIEDAAQRNKPFFMYLAFNAPHDPRQSPQEYVDMYPPETLSLPASFLPENPHNGKIGIDRTSRDERLAPFPRTEEAVQIHRSEYYALVTHLDAQIGRILEGLEKSGMVDNTIIIYSADHGLALGAHGLLGKQNMFEHSIRAPLIFVGPGFEANKKIELPVYIQDLMASSYELAGAPVPSDIQFKSLLPYLKNKDRKPYKAIYGAFKKDAQRMVIENEMKLILYPLISEILLYNLEKDPNGLNDLSKKPEYKNIIEQLYVELKHQQKLVGDKLDLDPHYPELN